MVESVEFIGMAIIAISTLLSILILYYFRILSNLLKVVGIYIIAGAAIEVIATALYYEGENNLKFLHLFTLFEFVILSHLFHQLFVLLKSKIKIYYVAIPVTAFIIINTLFIQDIKGYNSYSSTLTSIILLAYCIHFFILILDIEIKNYQFIILKWFVICLFLYHCISLIIMLFGNMFLDFSQEAQSYIWAFRSIIIFATKAILAFFFVKLFFFNRNLKVS